jgi:phosphoribosylglycinamide formyltransferase-1
MSVKKIVILFSGEGSNLENIVKKLHKKDIKGCRIEVSGAICNKEDAKGIQRCKRLGIPFGVIKHTAFNSREEFDEKLVESVLKFGADLVVLAGFMRVLTPVFTERLKAINLHPSLLPLFKGANAIERSFNSDMKVGGVSVLFVSSELDGGEIISQKCFQKDDGMSFEEFKKRIKELEFELLPQAIVKILKD